MKHKSAMISAVIALSLVGCSDSDDSDDKTATGIFKDSNVAGVSYVSGEQSGITESDGSFTYETGSTVSFSIGGVEIGSAQGNSIITPVDLVTNGSSDSTQVQNIVRFLMTLDSDGDPENGLSIASAVRTAASSWEQVNFSGSDFENVMSTIVTSAQAVDSSGSYSLPSAAEAKSHIETTLLCAYSGAFKGTYSGGDSGTWGFLVDASNGNVEGVAYSTAEEEIISLTGNTPVSFNQTRSFVSGDTSTGASFSGRFPSSDTVSGSWENSTFALSGDFSGTRIGGSVKAKYRFTGHYTGSDYGLFSFDIDDANKVTGVAYSIVEDELHSVTGDLTNTLLLAESSSGAAITATLDTANGTISNAEWVLSSESAEGSFTGSGCKLN